MANSQYCVTHSPEFTDEQRKAWNAKGGRHSASVERVKRQLPDIEVMTTQEVRALMGLVLRNVIAGKIDPPVANAAANAARAIGELTRVQADELISENELLLEALEQRAS